VPYFITGKQEYGKILPDHTDETQKELPKLDSNTNGENPIFVKYTVTRTGTQDLNDKEKNFPLETIEISYSLDDLHYIKAGEMAAVPGRWVGVKNGVFSVSSHPDSKGYARIDYVDYK
jgi:hypothetical protein